jgi:hypothetical protein
LSSLKMFFNVAMQTLSCFTFMTAAAIQKYNTDVNENVNNDNDNNNYYIKYSMTH